MTLSLKWGHQWHHARAAAHQQRPAIVSRPVEQSTSFVRRDDKKTIDAIRYYARTETFEQHAATSLAARSAFMPACHAQVFNASNLLNKLDAVVAHDGIDRQSAKQLQMSLKPYTSRRIALRSLQAMPCRLVKCDGLTIGRVRVGGFIRSLAKKPPPLAPWMPKQKYQTKMDSGGAETTKSSISRKRVINAKSAHLSRRAVFPVCNE